ncbi:cytochrome P450 [Macrolepiota fuliginosa MF-IS2]|uniref:Cytochrome P450 n=1 Tax=Macrolepiota fuliginosa MF-IS2 TaxID=1400762 RepID=A0A9P5XFM6_9AGAR|nr:cytochrome P450 [Macrolepiota fuliginosa MF-IS2]
MALVSALLVVVALLIVRTLYRRLTSISIAHIPGPKSNSFLYGDLCELLQNQVGEVEFKWQELYGDVIRFRGAFGEDRLMISDPKALQYIYQTTGYHFQKQPEKRAISEIIAGRGIIWADGEDHRRHRRILLPGFGAPESRAFAPIFSSYASKVVEKWRDTLATQGEDSAVFDIPTWISRAMLDSIGVAAFDYHFGSLDDSNNAVTRVWKGVLTETFGSITKRDIFVQSVLQYVPFTLLSYIPNPKMNHLRRAGRVLTDVAKSLIEEKTEAVNQGKKSRDIMSILVKANLSEDKMSQLNEEEMLAQMRTLLLAGHETTSNSLTWTLLELAKRPEMQIRLRHEIEAKKRDVHARGDVEFTTTDYDSMPYLNAILKESLRYNPPTYNTFRQASRDDIIPLSKPITTTTGEVITKLPVPKGLRIVTSILAYNRNEDVFGSDAHVFNPDRWLRKDSITKGAAVGVYGNMLTFAAGIRSCIGWRFAVIELQAFLVELISNFEFSLTPEAHKLRREACFVMIPTIEGQLEKGCQLPLKVTLASRSD